MQTITNNYKQVAWAKNAVVYEVNIRQYTPEGTFASFAKHMPRLNKMGVSVLWLMPITPISNLEMKGSMGSPYACSSYVQTNPQQGSLADFKVLVNTAHKLGMRVIIDWVANHTGWDHEWTKSNPGFYKKNLLTGSFKTPDGMEDIIELDHTNEEMQNALIAAMQFWVDELDIDGFRCDLASWVPVGFWQNARTTLEKSCKPLFWLAEADQVDNVEYMQVFDVAYTWSFMHLSEDYANQKISFDALMEIILKYNSTHLGVGMSLWFTSNHDENSWNGTEYEKYGVLAKPFAVFSFLWDGLPLIYSGQELPNRKRLKFFDKDPIEWGDLHLDDFYGTLAHLKAKNKALLANDSAVRTRLLHAVNDCLVFERQNNTANDAVICLINFGLNTFDFEVNESMFFGKKYRNVFSGEMVDFAVKKNLTIGSRKYLVLELMPEE